MTAARCGSNPNVQLTPGDRQALDDFRAYLAALPPRTHTPDREHVDDGGRRGTTMHLKRACNGCGQLLGDVDDRDVDEHGELTDVRSECEHCRPLAELEAAGCKTWHLLRRDIWEIDGELNDLNVVTKGYTESLDGRLKLVGLRVGHQPDAVVAYFGDWIIRHPDGQFTVHKAPVQSTYERSAAGLHTLEVTS